MTLEELKGLQEGAAVFFTDNCDTYHYAMVMDSPFIDDSKHKNYFDECKVSFLPIDENYPCDRDCTMSVDEFIAKFNVVDSINEDMVFPQIYMTLKNIEENINRVRVTMSYQRAELHQQHFEEVTGIHPNDKFIDDQGYIHKFLYMSPSKKNRPNVVIERSFNGNPYPAILYGKSDPKLWKLFQKI